jgi:uncharacterized protein YjbI with pentapeptide repeats
MCNHVYISDYSKSHRSLGVKCPYTTLYDQLSKDPPIPDAVKSTGGPGNFSLPQDSDGLCLFHSKAADWKRAQGFGSRFLQLLSILNARADGSSYYDFAEFVFVADVDSGGKPSKAAWQLSDLTFQKSALFKGASFLDGVDVTDVNFENGAMFEETTFHDRLTFKRVRLRGADFGRSLLKGKVDFRETTFDNYSLFRSARFVGSAVSFEASSFEGVSDFSDVSFEPEGIAGAVTFRNVSFADFLDFKETSFNCPLSFANVTFGSLVEFIDTSFGFVGSTARYTGAAVQFQQIELLEKAELNFRSTNASKKLFNHDVSFSFKSDPQGIIRFENVNFSNITPTSRKLLAALTTSGKVQIGSGCIKYRFQTEVKTIQLSEGNTQLALELAGTFVNYFTAQNGLNLGLEVVERAPSHVAFFYFTDEDIQESEFLERLRRTEQDLWNLLAVNPDVFRLLEGVGSEEALVSPQSTIVNAVDGVSALMGTFFRVGVRIATGRWREADTRSLLEAIRFNAEGIEERAVNLHKVIVGRYTGRSLAGLSRTQNEGLPPMESVGRNLLTGSVGSNEGQNKPPKLTILFLSANSSGFPLKLDEEVSRIQTNLKLAKVRDSLIFRQEWAVTIDTLMQSILDESPNVVQFSGHGKQSGIVLQDAVGNPAVVTTEALESLFKLFKDNVRCVVLNSCFSEHQARAIRTHIPYVVGVLNAIPDNAAIAFSTGFYKGIGAGQDVPFAFELGKVAMKLWGFTDESAAVLL